MTKHSGPSPGKITDLPGNITPEGCEKPEKIYPLYWLAPARDLGVRRIRVSSLCSLVGAAAKCAHDSNIYHYPKLCRIVKYVLMALGLEAKGQKEPAIKVVKIGGKYFVERGHRFLLLAKALNLDYVSVRIMEYCYENLKRNMQVLKYPDLEIVAIAAGQKGSYNYLGVSAENADVLLKQHRIPLVDHTAVMAKACSGAPAITLRRRDRDGSTPAALGNRPQFTVIKNKRE